MSDNTPLKTPWPAPRPGQTWRFNCGSGPADVLRVSALSDDGTVHFAPVFGGHYLARDGAKSHVESMTTLPECERWVCLDPEEHEGIEAG